MFMTSSSHLHTDRICKTSSCSPHVVQRHLQHLKDVCMATTSVRHLLVEPSTEHLRFGYQHVRQLLRRSMCSPTACVINNVLANCISQQVVRQLIGSTVWSPTARFTDRSFTGQHHNRCRVPTGYITWSAQYLHARNICALTT